MARKLTRRQMLGTGAVAAGSIMAASCAQEQSGDMAQSSGAPKTFWEPGPNKDLVRDLTPGTTPIRLGTHLGYGRKGGENMTETVKLIKDGGFSGAVSNPAFINPLSDSELTELNAALKQYDVVVFEVGGYTNMIHPDPAVRQENLKSLAVAIECADKVGCPMVGTISGGCDPVNFFNVHPDNWTKKTWDLLVDACHQVINDTAGMKAAIGMEAQVTTNQDTPQSHRRLIDDVGSPRLGVNLDPVNMCSLANYYHTTELLTDCFDLLGESILGAHAKDTYIWPDKQTVHVQEVAAGRGVMDYETYLVGLSRLKWARTLLPEHVPPEEIIFAGNYIREVAAKVGVTIM